MSKAQPQTATAWFDKQIVFPQTSLAWLPLRACPKRCPEPVAADVGRRISCRNRVAICLLTSAASILVLISSAALAQTATGYLWAVPSGTPDEPLGVGFDSRGHVRTLAQGSVGNMNNKVSLFFHTYDTNGVLLESVVASNNFATFINAVFDPSGNAYVTGEFGHSGQFGSILLTNPGPSTVVFVAKYSPAGVAVWATSSSGGFGATASAIALDSAGNSYITGDFLGTVASPAKFGPSSLLNYFPPENDPFVAKVDATGKIVWGARFGDGYMRTGVGIAVDSSGNSYAGGSYSTATGTEQLVAKFTTAGVLAWTRTSQTANSNQFAMLTAQATAVDPQGNIVVAGNLARTNRIGNYILATPSGNDSDLELTRYDSAGNVQWAAQAGGTNADGIMQMTLDSSGNTYVQGFYDTRTVIAGAVLTNSGLGYYLAKCTGQGAFSWGLPFVSAIARLGAAPDGALYVTVPTGGGVTPSWLYKIGTVSAPLITVQPTNQLIQANSSTRLIVGAAPGSILTYQWFRGLTGDTSNPVVGEVSNVFVTPVLSAPASYWVRVSNPAGNADSSTATISFIVPPMPPKIVTPIQNVLIMRGQSATLSVVAAGSEPLTYQWYQLLNGTTHITIPDATNNAYTTPPLTNYMTYSVIVRNVAGSAESQGSVMVVAPVVINQQPQSMTISNGQSVTLSVAATGGQFINYQWFIGDSGDTNNPIVGAVFNTYTTPPLTASAHYWVLLTSPPSRVESQTVVLTLPDSRASLALLSLSGGRLNLHLTAPPASRWQVQSSTNLSIWAPAAGLATIQIDASGATNIAALVDPSKATFYRATLLR